ncbi:recombinase family protein [uncultured Clostridium sp.]|uniref:recombinase family protein n=1 Tax=uncultured Clostridium sp. TaxID=59620 RepID=UPI0028E1B849|nr:recombinase family protein [uncultured Clostridium sp.]
MVFGYTSSHNDERLSSEDPLIQLMSLGCDEVIEEQKDMSDNPMLDKLIKKLKANDTLIITALDEIATNLLDGFKTIKNLVEKDVTVNILNMGIFDNSDNGKLLLNVFSMYLTLDQFEKKNNISSEIAVTAVVKKRARKFTDDKIEKALSLLKIFGGTLSYKQVTEETGISKSTLLREVIKRKPIDNE